MRAATASWTGGNGSAAARSAYCRSVFAVAPADDGRDVALLVSSAPVRDGAGRITGAVKVFQDISAIKELEQQKDRFLAAVSHDLKNPLVAIKGQAQLSRRRLERRGALDPAQALESLRRIEESADRLASMVDELLDAARLQMGRTLELDRRPTDLAALARRVAEEYATSARRHIRLVVPEGAVMAEWDGVRLGRVLDNLVSNAVKYSPEDSEIVLTIEREDRDGADWVAVRVRDEGMGIPAGDLPHIFEHFRRGSNVRGRVTGIGIGLAGARTIVEQHGGAIGVESREGGGSTFTVRIPLSGATTAGAERDGEP
jgi:signal transduction histidine kinase